MISIGRRLLTGNGKGGLLVVALTLPPPAEDRWLGRRLGVRNPALETRIQDLRLAETRLECDDDGLYVVVLSLIWSYSLATLCACCHASSLSASNDWI